MPKMLSIFGFFFQFFFVWLLRHGKNLHNLMCFFSVAYKGFEEFQGLLVVCVDSGFKLLN